METKYYSKIDKDELLKKFLCVDISNIPNKYCIYIVRNLISNKVYIGKTKSIKTRGYNYINAYLKGDTCGSSLLEDMIKIGLEKFKMEPIEYADTDKSASIKEKYYIDLFNSIQFGYNQILGSANYNSRSRPRIKTGVPHTLYSKVIKSKIICALNYKERKIIFSTGLKLFGDYIHRDKDEIKSYARRQTMVDNYFIYYMNPEDFNTQLESANKKVIKNSIYSDCNLQYGLFIEYANYIIELLKYDNNPEDFDVYFITQDNSELGYTFKDYKHIINQIHL